MNNGFQESTKILALTNYGFISASLLNSASYYSFLFLLLLSLKISYSILMRFISISFEISKRYKIFKLNTIMPSSNIHWSSQTRESTGDRLAFSGFRTSSSYNSSKLIRSRITTGTLLIKLI